MSIIRMGCKTLTLNCAYCGRQACQTRTSSIMCAAPQQDPRGRSDRTDITVFRGFSSPSAAPQREMFCPGWHMTCRGKGAGQLPSSRCKVSNNSTVSIHVDSSDQQPTHSSSPQTEEQRQTCLVDTHNALERHVSHAIYRVSSCRRTIVRHVDVQRLQHLRQNTPLHAPERQVLQSALQVHSRACAQHARACYLNNALRIASAGRR